MVWIELNENGTIHVKNHEEDSNQSSENNAIDLSPDYTEIIREIRI